MKKILAMAVATIIMVSGLTACSDNNDEKETSSGEAKNTTSAETTESYITKISGSATASGSSALLPLAQAAAEEFMRINDDASIIVNGGGSGTGLKQVADGSVDIGNSDVSAEKKLDEDIAKELVDHKVCTVTMAAVVNKELGIDSLSKQQLIDIFTAKTTNWSEVGGPDVDIMLVTRPSSSGTRALFKEFALGGVDEASNSSLETDDSGTLLETVQNNKGAIGYVALSYLVNNDKVKALAIDGVAPTLENTYNGSYTVWGYEHMYTKGEGSDIAQEFIKYMMSDDFASYIEAMGYGASSKLTDKAIATHE